MVSTFVLMDQNSWQSPFSSIQKISSCVLCNRNLQVRNGGVTGLSHCMIGFLKTTSECRAGLGARRSILRARLGSLSGSHGVSATDCQFPVLLGRRLGVAVLVGPPVEAAIATAPTLGAAFDAELSVGSDVWWQCAQCRHTVQAPNLRANSARNLSAGPSFIPIGPVRWSSDSNGNAAPSIRWSRKFCNIMFTLVFIFSIHHIRSNNNLVTHFTFINEF